MSINLAALARSAMMPIVRTSLLALIVVLAGCSQVASKNVIGETALISLSEAGIEYLARIDTGARVTSVHAFDVEVSNGSHEKQDNVDKMISFTTENEHGRRERINTRITEVAKVRNAQGIEYRYVVNMNLRWQGLGKSTEVNLRDRSAMTYKLLIGRNWLANDFVVDVDKSDGLIK